jgi:hypothetical protein
MKPRTALAATLPALFPFSCASVAGADAAARFTRAARVPVAGKGTRLVAALTGDESTGQAAAGRMSFDLILKPGTYAVPPAE